MASCMNTDYTPHLKLSGVQAVPGQLTEEVKQLWRSPRGRIAFQVTLEGAAEGLLIFYLG